MSRRNGQIRELVKRGDAVYHRRTASKAALRRAASGAFKTVRLKKGVRIAKASKAIH